ncbi:30S ribosomal protein S9 [Enterobacteriaceae bacterium ET-AT1-13]|uniref:30S ribosomal protein S9 n=2 Tax=Cacopsylla melanoneura TaxID=428564 RepID=A0A8D8S9I2_9HEMI|nr:30S ribosomal protein S9 [Enterobacteriaceae bacterium ET-AT1-13]WGS66473.1 30S ribosomal protein S9 [Enterobacteriaceae bacterium Cmel17]WMC17498.1 MAG: 30S ribosomal protein S9 [Enterobacteriaceae bacterium Cmel21]WMC17705.1 MAG: 30S ribosomal protein S9 [Enterobacteriaceae bacterium PSmelAO3-2]WMC17909.1 MAG: 30S ribosomal protein S9 [Enterobacteriaceae bacterium PSmelAO3-1]WMC18112.1 MAG: 30S ribosomal protein S9 [Enterobacteriaceae bacterium PSmelAO1]
MNNKQYYGTGRRKTSTARVFMKSGNGNFIINNNNINKYFTNKNQQLKICQPLNLVKIINIVNLYITVKGGGISSQAEAIRHGISRAILNYNNNLRYILKKEGYISRDSRKVERKKPGFKKSRKKPQFSKR